MADVKSDIDHAVKHFNDGLNCCQAILLTYGGLLGLARESALRLGTGFGGGLARHAEVCGAVTGAVMVISIKYGMTRKNDDDAKEKTYELVGEFIKKFREKHDTIVCRDLLGCDISTEKGHKKAKKDEKFKKICPEFVKTAAEILEEIL
jgi:C_GCAxxG_C_C family probable redox protein